jgi:hypothetical protein
VFVKKNGYTFQYTIDMNAGLVVATRDSSPGLASPPSQLIVWSEDRGIYYFRRVCAGNAALDTGSIFNGGYEFSGIQINGIPVTRVLGNSASGKAAAGFRFMDSRGRKTVLSGFLESMPVSLFDVRGRRLFSGFSDKNGIIDLNAVCSPGGCPSGPLVVKCKDSHGKAVISTIKIR